MRWLTCAICGLSVLMSAGCSPMSAAKVGLTVVKGVQADMIPIRDVSGGTLRTFNSIKLGSVTTDVGRICPAAVLAQIRAQMPPALAEETKKRFKGGPKVLKIEVVCRFFKKKSLIVSEGRLDLVVTLIDAHSGGEIGQYYVEGISESPLHTGIDDMAKGVCREVAKFLDDRKKEAEK